MERSIFAQLSPAEFNRVYVSTLSRISTPLIREVQQTNAQLEVLSEEMEDAKKNAALKRVRTTLFHLQTGTGMDGVHKVSLDRLESAGVLQAFGYALPIISSDTGDCFRLEDVPFTRGVAHESRAQLGIRELGYSTEMERELTDDQFSKALGATTNEGPKQLVISIHGMAELVRVSLGVKIGSAKRTQKYAEASFGEMLKEHSSLLQGYYADLRLFEAAIRYLAQLQASGSPVFLREQDLGQNRKMLILDVLGLTQQDSFRKLQV